MLTQVAAIAGSFEPIELTAKLTHQIPPRVNGPALLQFIRLSNRILASTLLTGKIIFRELGHAIFTSRNLMHSSFPSYYGDIMRESYW